MASFTEPDVRPLRVTLLFWRTVLPSALRTVTEEVFLPRESVPVLPEGRAGVTSRREVTLPEEARTALPLLERTALPLAEDPERVAEPMRTEPSLERTVLLLVPELERTVPELERVELELLLERVELLLPERTGFCEETEGEELERAELL